ncbi:MAG: hypothetical protein ACK5MK_12995 [Dysgonomonas sp.]
MIRTTILIFILSLASIQLYSQNFYEDGSMMLSEVSGKKNYGYEPNSKTSIKVGKIENEQAFLRTLLGPNGESIQFRRLGSCCEFKSKSAAFGSGFLDKYEIQYEGLNTPIILYINGYEFENPQCPYGFTFKTIDKIEKIVVLQQDNALQVKPCNEKNIFIVDNEFLLKEKVGELPIVDKNPTYEGGIDVLKAYFAKQSLTDNKAKNIVFRVTIGFIVNCNGEVGNLQLLTRGKGDLETLANQVLEKVNEIPRGWLPANKDGKAVDCYQVLSFTVIDGKLDKVSYR